jgi:uncharacterized protein with GYD domain
MLHYLIQAVYKPEVIAALAKNPQDRVEVVREVVQRLGGRLDAGGLLFGDVDLQLVGFCSLPDNVTAAALGMCIAAGGSVTSVKTTPLISGGEALEALRRAAAAGYRPPGL